MFHVSGTHVLNRPLIEYAGLPVKYSVLRCRPVVLGSPLGLDVVSDGPIADIAGLPARTA